MGYKCIDCGKSMNIPKERYWDQAKRCNGCWKSYRKVKTSFERKNRALLARR